MRVLSRPYDNSINVTNYDYNDTASHQTQDDADAHE